MKRYEAIIYGSYGYTGALIAKLCKAKGLNILLSGRNGIKLKEQSDATGYPFEEAHIDDDPALIRLLEKGEAGHPLCRTFSNNGQTNGQRLPENRNTLHRHNG